jgi:hypothetical protein
MQQLVDLSQQVIADQQAMMASMQRNSENLVSADAQARKELVAASKEQNAGFAIARRDIDQMRYAIVALTIGCGLTSKAIYQSPY